ncbi:MAG: type VI secretion system protein TssA [Desulforegulaceae bacterium]|nr:type VI secretion system protein TssA [Desulforegulaceae bacterium]
MVSDSLGKIPITKENPCGIDITYEPEFEELQQEIDKLSIVSSNPEGVDWGKVVNLSELILKEKSKNLLVAVYLSQGLIKTKGFEGFLTGTKIISDILENYWDSFFPPPKRKKGRSNSIRWWYEKTDLYLKNIDPEFRINKEDANFLIKQIKALDSLLSEKFEDSPILNTIIQNVQKIPFNLEKEDAKIDEIPKPSKAEKIENNESQNIPQTIKESLKKESPEKENLSNKVLPEQVNSELIKNDKDAAKALKQGFDILVKTCNYYFFKDISNPVSYKISRLYTWAQIEQLPVTEKNNKTLLPPPDSAIKKSIENMIFSKNYESAVITSENNLRNYIFWLDLNRYSAAALGEMGEKYLKAKITIETETSGFIKKFINLENFCFSDGTPFADNETKSWLKSISGQTEKSDESFSVCGDEVYLKVLEIQKKAEIFFKNKKLYEAVFLFENGLLEAKSLREKILLRIYLSKFFSDIGKPQLSFPHLQKIEEAINDFRLEEFEPEIAVLGYTLIYKAYKLSNNETLVSKSSYYLDKISVIKPAKGFRLDDS